MNLEHVQTLVLRAPVGGAVAHQILRIPDEKAQVAAELLAGLKQPLSFGVKNTADPRTSIGFSFAGLEALGVPERYLRLFRLMAPAFAEGAVRRSANAGDSGSSAPLNWEPRFHQENAHVLVSWHGEVNEVRKCAGEFGETWKKSIDVNTPDDYLEGERLGHPPKQDGEWVHFGFRDGISEICIDDEDPRPLAPDCRRHERGTLLLGYVNDAGFNPFALTRAPAKVRAFFHDSSFGILRKIEQDVKAFEDQLDRWEKEMGSVINPPAMLDSVKAKLWIRDFVKAKLCGRWPDGRQLHPGDLEPSGGLKQNLTKDTKGEGCPFGSHVRRMRAAPDRNGNLFERPLQRRSVPFGLAAWSERPTDGEPRGLLGHFFCASIEDQFEHLLGQWSARPPLGFPPEDRALDPFGGSHENADAALEVPLKGRPTQSLRGFSAWTTNNGTMYAWHPGEIGLRALLKYDFAPEEDERPWL